MNSQTLDTNTITSRFLDNFNNLIILEINNENINRPINDLIVEKYREQNIFSFHSGNIIIFDIQENKIIQNTIDLKNRKYKIIIRPIAI